MALDTYYTYRFLIQICTANLHVCVNIHVCILCLCDINVYYADVNVHVHNTDVTCVQNF